MARKKPSLVAPLKRDQLDLGWDQSGRPFMSCQAKKAANAEKSTVSSNMIGKKAGTVRQSYGLPCTITGYKNQDGPNSTITAVNRPVMPPAKTTALNQDLPRPMASSMP